MKITKAIQFFLKPGERLSHKVIRAGLWTVTQRITTRLLGLVRIIVLARLLGPADFGLVGIALLVSSILESFTRMGFISALVQQKEDVKDYLNTAQTIYLAQATVVGGVLFAGGPLMARFFNNNAAGPIIQVMGAIKILEGFTNVKMLVLSRKELNFDRMFIIDLSSVLADLFVAIPLALILRNAWALVFGAAASNVVGVIVSYILYPCWPRLSLDIQKARTLFRFGRWVFLYSVAAIFSGKADSFLVTKILGVSFLGLYQIAGRLSNYTINEIGSVIDDISFPTFSKIQDNLPIVRKAFLDSIELRAAVSFPFMVVIFLIAPDFTRLGLGEEWLPAVVAMQILGFAGAIRLISGTGSFFQALGRPWMSLYMNLLMALVLIIVIYPLCKTFGINGAAIAVLISSFAYLPFVLYYPKKIIGVNTIQIAKQLVFPFGTSVVMGMVMWVIKQGLGQVDPFRFMIIVALSGISYLCLNLILWRQFSCGPLATVARLGA